MRRSLAIAPPDSLRPTDGALGEGGREGEREGEREGRRGITASRFAFLWRCEREGRGGGGRGEGKTGIGKGVGGERGERKREERGRGERERAERAAEGGSIPFRFAK